MDFTSERFQIENILQERGYISGPWRVSLYERYDGAPIYVFSEEHHDNGNCASQGVKSAHVTSVVHDILTKTDYSHVLVEHFLHASEVTREDDTVCSIAPPTGSLENLRSCLEVLMNPTVCKKCKDRIHFIDPRADIVCVLPDGNLFKAITEYSVKCAASGNYSDAILVLYEALIHPLWSVLPDKKLLIGRLKGQFEDFFDKLPPHKKAQFDAMWKREISDQFSELLGIYNAMHTKFCMDRSGTLEDFKAAVEHVLMNYKLFTNTFLDLWTLCVIDTIKKDTVSAILVYFGSLHGQNVERLLNEMDYGRRGFFTNGPMRVIEDPGANACINIRR
jgi:hypothetical protein